MDKTTKLILWQRITIGSLTGATLLSMWQVHLYQQARAGDWQAIERLEDRIADLYQSQGQTRLEDQNRITDLTLQVKSDQEMIATLGKSSKIETSSHNPEDERIIRDLSVRLRKYEARYGKISPTGKGEGNYIANQKNNIPFGYDFVAPIRLSPRPISHPTSRQPAVRSAKFRTDATKTVRL